MQKITLNEGWLFAKGTITMMELFMGSSERIQTVDLPHDAMIHQSRTPDTKNAHQTGFYPGGEYTYIKRWTVPEDWQGKSVTLEFEGVADTCRIYLNGDLAAEHYNPYSGIWVDATNYFHPGEESEIKVEVRSVEPSSRWYSGAGLYRPVNAWVGGAVHIPAQGVRVTTIQANAGIAAVEVRTGIRNRGQTAQALRAETVLYAPDGSVAAADSAPVTAFGECTQNHIQHLTVENPLLWSDETSNLYVCEVRLWDGETLVDRESVKVGLRTLSLNAKEGLCINGKPTKLRGTCIHHDNGVIGAATFPDAEYRRCAQLKAAGFNAIRSSHHPMSKAMLDACDELGMLVMDELTDMWTRTKNPHDYANYFPQFWRQDVAEMVAKDYNHPSVILYSTGNEIPEAGSPRGAEWNRRLNATLKALDPTRYTTSGINGLMASTDKMGEIMMEATGMSEEELASMMAPAGSNGETAGADEINGMAEVMVGPMADAIACSKTLEGIIGEFAAATDIAGYNYLTGLHEEEHRRHPNRVVLGTETFPADIVNLWAIVKRNPHVLGDFTWTGYDYLGEAGCGTFHYDGGVNFSAHWPDRLAGIGDMTILGDRKPISYLREAVYGLTRNPAIGVLRMDRDARGVAKTPWMWKDNIASWTWPGHEGESASVDIYADADEVELLLNGASFGRQNVRDTFVATFEVPYAPGTLEAVSYADGREVGRSMLRSAGKIAGLRIEADRPELPADGQSLAFVKVYPVDGAGNRNRFQKVPVTVAVEGAATLQGFGSADPSCEGSYQDTTWNTYDGTVMVVLRASKVPGEAKITFTAPGCESVNVTLDIQ